jgi:transposase
MLVNQDSKDIEWDALGNGYKGVIYDPLASGERWALLFSKQAYKRELITFNEFIGKALVKEEKALKQLCKPGKPVFGCEKDALKVAKKWHKSLKYHCCEFSIESIARYSKAGKPPKGATPDIIEYKLSGKMTDDKKERSRLRNRLGRFILGTNVTTDVAPINLIKEQNK